MTAKFSKRCIAYIVDIFLVAIVLTLITAFFPKSDNIKALNSEMDEINELFLKEEIGMGNYIYRYSAITYQLDREQVMNTIVNTVLILIYFIILPYFLNGQTYGKKLLKIRVVREDGEALGVSDLLIRSIIVNGFAFMLIGLAFVYLIPSLVYFISITILGLVQIGLIIVSIIYMTKREDRKGIQDLITNTKVIECN